jgi:hypothetical protein
VRLVVLLITAITLVAGACASADAQLTGSHAPAELTQTKSLPAALATARRTGSVSDVRLPTFVLPAVAVLEAPRGVVAEQDAVVRPGYRWLRPSNVTARGPPRA